jgi:hypothetical protein
MANRVLVRSEASNSNASISASVNRGNALMASVKFGLHHGRDFGLLNETNATLHEPLRRLHITNPPATLRLEANSREPTPAIVEEDATAGS